MDEALEVVDLVADFGLEGIVTWLFRLVGLLVVLTGVGLWLFVDVGLVIPAALVVVGVVLLVAPSVLLALAELA